MEYLYSILAKKEQKEEKEKYPLPPPTHTHTTQTDPHTHPHKKSRTLDVHQDDRLKIFMHVYTYIIQANEGLPKIGDAMHLGKQQ